MSKFIDDLKRAGDGAPSPIGFMPRQPVAAPCRMQLLAIVAPEDLDRVTEFLDGADTVLLPVASENPSKKRLTGFSGAAGRTPWGGWLKGKNAAIPELVKAGCDFIVFSGATVLTAAAEEKTGKILELAPSTTDTMLRSAGNLPIDAVFINDDSVGEGPLTWQHLLQFQRCAALLTKPMLAPVPADAGTEELKLLWEAGVVCAVVDTEGISPEKFKALRKTIDGTKFPPRGRRREKLDATMPRPQLEAVDIGHEEEEEEE